uniref:Cohesin complex subunit SCC1 n=1 Tax=Tetraselmis sp. GSL018 TaxID=582737 RepID=A0A061S4Z0_9CHLO
MFYSTQILAKKGPLGTIWIAAHLERRLKRQQVFETSITASVDSIINPDAPLALRLSGQLLLGVVRVYSRKVGYLFQDCNDTLLKVKSAFTQTGRVDLPEDQATVNPMLITLPDNYDHVDFLAEASAGLNLLLSAGEPRLGEELTFTVRDDSITLNADFNALAFHTAPAQDELFEGGEELDLENEGFIVDGGSPERLRAEARNSEEEEVEDPEILRAAETPGELPSLDLGAGDSGAKGTPLATGPMESPPAQPLAEFGEIPMSSTTPGHAADPLGGLGAGQTPTFLGGTPGGELAAIGETPRHEGAADEVGGPESPQRGRGGTPAPAAHRPQRRVEVTMDDGTDGRPGKEIPGATIRALLQDRTSLMTDRGFRSAGSRRKRAKASAKAVQLQALALARQPAVPGVVSDPLRELWAAATMASVEARADADRAAKQARRQPSRRRVEAGAAATPPEAQPDEDEEDMDVDIASLAKRRRLQTAEEPREQTPAPGPPESWTPLPEAPTPATAVGECAPGTAEQAFPSGLRARSAHGGGEGGPSRGGGEQRGG